MKKKEKKTNNKTKTNKPCWNKYIHDTYMCVGIYTHTCIYTYTHMHICFFTLPRYWYLFSNLLVFPEGFLVYKNEYSSIPSVIP